MTMEKTGNETKSAATEKAPKSENKATVPDKNAAQAYGAGVVPFTSIKFVLMTEKSVQGIEAQNRMVFIVDRKATKGSIAKEITATFNTPVKSVRTMFDQEGRKRAFVAFKNAGAAGEVAIKLGVI